jgi:hypothetical protein
VRVNVAGACTCEFGGSLFGTMRQFWRQIREHTS